MKNMKTTLIGLSDSIESISIFAAIRKALTAMIPIIIIGSLSLMLISLPIPLFQDFIENIFNGQLYLILKLIVAGTLGMMSIYLVISLSYFYASTFIDESNELFLISIASLACYFIMIGDITIGTLPSSHDGGSFFTAIFSSIITCFIYKNVRKIFSPQPLSLSLNDNSFFLTSLKILIPMSFILILFTSMNTLISGIFKVSGLQGLFSAGCQNIFNHIGNSYPAMLIYSVLVQIMWFFGIHGDNILDPVASDSFMEISDHIFSRTFYDIFVNIGGSGLILSFIFAIILVSKNKELNYKTLLGLLPASFNISEPITIGIPIIFNPIFFIPFLLVPLVSGTIAYAATYFGFVPVVNNTVEWTTPVFFSGYYATGSCSGTLLQFILICVGALIYAPFISLYEEHLSIAAKRNVSSLVEYMKDCELNNNPPNLLKLNGSNGTTAKILSKELNDAINNNEIYFKFQPIMNSDSHCIGAESLVRWNHPLIGEVYPPLIIELATESGLLEDIERVLIRTSCELIKEIEKLTGDSIKISINATQASFTRQNFEEMISNEIYRYGINTACLNIELTENEVYTCNKKIEEKFSNLQTRGHKLAMDDFGTGNTSLKYLKVNRFDIVKLDGFLTLDIETNELNQDIIRSICELGTSLGFDVVAEHVETEAQKKLLDNLGCCYYQGYYFSPALDKTDFIQYFTSHNLLMT